MGDDNDYLVLSDNGFGTRDNSSDYLLSIYRIRPDFRTATGGPGIIHVNQIINLRDPHSHLPYSITRGGDRVLTGSDLDPESFRQAPDGSYWIGEEFNPALLHFSADGLLLAPPFMLTGLHSTGNPGGHEANLPRSRGFEGMSISPEGKWLYPMLEGALQDAAAGINIYTFNVEEKKFVNQNANQPSFRYRLDDGATAIGDFTMFSNTAGLVIERDSAEGKKARLKKIYRVDFRTREADGFLRKSLVADLLNIEDPHDLNGDGDRKFTFPFWTIEGLVILDATTLGIVNDNNYPLGQARDNSGTKPDNTEFILLEVDPLWEEITSYN